MKANTWHPIEIQKEIRNSREKDKRPKQFNKAHQRWCCCENRKRNV